MNLQIVILYLSIVHTTLSTQKRRVRLQCTKRKISVYESVYGNSRQTHVKIGEVYTPELAALLMNGLSIGAQSRYKGKIVFNEGPITHNLNLDGVIYRENHGTLSIVDVRDLIAKRCDKIDSHFGA